MSKPLAGVFAFAVAVWAAAYLVPTPPKRIEIATAFKGGAYELFGTHYKEILARSGVELDVRITQGAAENIKLVNDPSSGVQVAFLQGGQSNRDQSPDLVSLGRVNYQPFWIFKRTSEQADDLRRMKPRAVAVGPPGSQMRLLAESLLGAPTTSGPEFVSTQGQPAMNALKDGSIDAAIFPGPMNSPIIQNMLRDPALSAIDFPNAEGLTKIRPYLVRLVVPAGSLDAARDIPAKAITIVGTTNLIVARKELHPGIVYLLAQALVEVHGGTGFFEAAGSFPTQTDPEYPFAESAQDYYRNGPTFINRYFPFWMVFYLQRGLALLLTTVAIAIPLFNIAPKAIQWFWRRRILALYRRLRVVEEDLHQRRDASDLLRLRDELDSIETAGRSLPKGSSELVIQLLAHIDRTRLRLHSQTDMASAEGQPI